MPSKDALRSMYEGYKPRECRCGCGQTFVATRADQRFVSPAHRERFWREERPVVRLPQGTTLETIRKAKRRPRSTAEEVFARYQQERPWIYTELVRLARKAKHRGHQRWSIAALFEVVRWDHLVGPDPHPEAEWHIDNRVKPLYAREIMKREADLAGFFETRRRKGE